MLIKNISFEVMNAVMQDTKSTILFQPQEIREVTKEDAEHLFMRYNTNNPPIFAEMAPTPTPVVTPVAELKAEESEEGYVCNICGKVNKSKAGLVAHRRFCKA